MKPQLSKENPLIASIKYHKALAGYSREQMAEVLGCGISTYGNRMAKPNDFTINEILSLSRLFDTTDFIMILLDMQGKRGKELHKQLIVS